MTDYQQDGFVIRRVQGEVVTNFPQAVIHHSPDGMEFGYGGSGPADMALNILEATLVETGYQGERMKCWKGDCFTLAWNLHQAFKWAFIAPIPREDGAFIPFQDVLDFLGIQKVED